MASDDVDNLIAKLKDKSEKVRAETWLNAAKVGAPAIKPLAAVMTSGESDLEVARAAKHALWSIVSGFGRIESEDQRKSILDALHSLMTDDWPDAFRREVLWMLSEIGDDSSVSSIVSVLKKFGAYR
jgi:HEAT repeat protein